MRPGFLRDPAVVAVELAEMRRECSALLDEYDRAAATPAPTLLHRHRKAATVAAVAAGLFLLVDLARRA